MDESARAVPPGSAPSRTAALTQLLNRLVTDRDRHPLGRVIDVVADQSDGRDLWVTGLLAALDDRQVFVPVQHLTPLNDAVMIDANAGSDFEPGPADELSAFLRAAPGSGQRSSIRSDWSSVDTLETRPAAGRAWSGAVCAGRTAGVCTDNFQVYCGNQPPAGVRRSAADVIGHLDVATIDEANVQAGQTNSDTISRAAGADAAKAPAPNLRRPSLARSSPRCPVARW